MIIAFAVVWIALVLVSVYVCGFGFGFVGKNFQHTKFVYMLKIRV
jgi:hypothetical protein